MRKFDIAQLFLLCSRRHDQPEDNTMRPIDHSEPATSTSATSATSADIEAARTAQLSIVQALMQATTPDWIQLELSIGQLKALMALASQQPLTVGGLAELLHIGKSAASILVDQLVQQGHAARTEDAEDRRRTLVKLTPSGSELVATLHQGARERLFVEWLEQLAPEDLAALARGLQALAAIAMGKSGQAVTSPNRQC
jgi:DNA-binding MarR family transcriptional regulator